MACLDARTRPPSRQARTWVEGSASPRSAAVRSSTLCAITSHRTSMSAKRPLKIGVAAVIANMMGANTAS